MNTMLADFQNLHLIPYLVIRSFAMLLVLPLPKESFSTGKKVLISVLLAIIALPFTEEQNISLIPTLFSEVIVGILLGLPIAVLVTLSGIFAELFDLQRGQTFASFFDPNSGPGSQSTTVIRYYVICSLLFMGCGEALVVDYIQSLKDIPVGSTLFNLSHGPYEGLLTFLLSQLKSLLVLYAPLSALLLMVDISFAFAAKAMPKIQITHDSFIVKTFLGFLALIVLSQSVFLSDVFVELSKPIYKSVVLG